MSMTYGEELLLKAESRQRFRRARKRRLTLLLPTGLAILWAMVDLVAARHDRLVEAEAGLGRMLVDHTQVIVWTMLFVLAPFVMSIRPDPIPAGAALTFLAGPLATPVLFGRGGWKWWQSLVVTLACALILLAARERRRRASLA